MALQIISAGMSAKTKQEIEAAIPKGVQTIFDDGSPITVNELISYMRPCGIGKVEALQGYQLRAELLCQVDRLKGHGVEGNASVQELRAVNFLIRDGLIQYVILGEYGEPLMTKLGDPASMISPTAPLPPPRPQ
jgi:hypothetical protein